jgi:hypothetical protein
VRRAFNVALRSASLSEAASVTATFGASCVTVGERGDEGAPGVARRRVPDLLGIEGAVQSVAYVFDIISRERAYRLGADDRRNPLGDHVPGYWYIGRDILARQKREGWGAHVIDRLSADLRSAFPEMKGLSPRNLNYMRAFAEAWSDRRIVQQVVARLPWGHRIPCTSSRPT